MKFPHSDKVEEKQVLVQQRPQSPRNLYPLDKVALDLR
jgi:hypothetical protein